MLSRTAAVLASLFFCLVLFAASAQAAFPGRNGRIAFSTFVEGGSYEILSVNPDGTDQVNLSRSPISDLEPAWSADGTRVAWTRGFYDNYEVWSMNADGTDQRNLSNDSQPDIAPAWSPDGMRIAFSTDRDQVSGFYNDFDIWLMRPDGSGQEQFTSNLVQNVQDVEAAWSPDGREIAYSHGVLDGRGIYVIDVQTKTVRVLTSGAGNDGRPSWSPDGSKIAFWSKRSGNGDIYVINADGSGLVRLTDDELPESQPAWSPDGTKIAFLHFPDIYSSGGYLYVMNADGSQQADLMGTARRFSYQVDWQPIDRPPDCWGVMASRPVLTTANRRFVAITLDGGTDPDGDPVTIAVDGVTQDEPVESSGDATSPDAIDDGDGQLRIRAERGPHGDGRVYRIVFTATDGRGGSCSGTTTVSVPRKRHKPAVDSAPPSYDSFARLASPKDGAAAGPRTRSSHDPVADRCLRRLGSAGNWSSCAKRS
jgi:dipeptidyl aminopeptidase/acylaminoacyl peptidase